jgi:excisionase family DNA binding protein
MDDQRRRYTTSQLVAARLLVKPKTIARWARGGEFPNAVRVDGSGWRIPVDDVEAFLERRRWKPKQRAVAS